MPPQVSSGDTVFLVSGCKPSEGKVPKIGIANDGRTREITAKEMQSILRKVEAVLLQRT